MPCSVTAHGHPALLLLCLHPPDLQPCPPQSSPGSPCQHSSPGERVQLRALHFPFKMGSGVQATVGAQAESNLAFSSPKKSVIEALNTEPPELSQSQLLTPLHGRGRSPLLQLLLSLSLCSVSQPSRAVTSRLWHPCPFSLWDPGSRGAEAPVLPLT